MDRIIVKVEKHGSQTRVTIPKRIAEESGLAGAELAAIRLNYHGIVEVGKVDVWEKQESGVSERKNGVD